MCNYFLKKNKYMFLFLNMKMRKMRKIEKKKKRKEEKGK
jgi:hypothetical protein